ncbi:hypothetical protein [Gottfriedia acidiceleris]|uniref:hypothetical protein n=1 Tax=Gottfriedia acidiceleris TaxID=371036 RepID=UPI00101C0532|nr:hypothetical protein [Gottfriedia acidiceleris]
MEHFTKKLKQYKLDELLLRNSIMSREMMLSGLKGDAVFKAVSFQSNIKYIQDYFFYITPWELADVSFYAINKSNDHKSKGVSDHNHILLMNDYRRASEIISSSVLDGIKDEDKLSYILVGHSQEQFWMQHVHEFIESFNRNYEILEHVDNFDIDEILLE